MIYTDGIHLIADTEEELHVFAKGIGLRRKDFIDHKHQHYNLIGNMITKAIVNGAMVKDTRFLVNVKLNADRRKLNLVMLG